MINLRERIKGIVIGAILSSTLIIVYPVFARIAEETIIVNFNNIRIEIDGQLVNTEYEPFIFDGRTYLPVRDVANAIGLDVEWDEATNTVQLFSTTEITQDNIPLSVKPYPEPTQQNQAIYIPQNITPSVAATPSGPINPPISAQMAAEIARDHLISIGVASARFHYIYMDIEGGIWVWSIEFDNQGRSYEFYIDVNTGNIVNFQIDS